MNIFFAYSVNNNLEEYQNPYLPREYKIDLSALYDMLLYLNPIYFKVLPNQGQINIIALKIQGWQCIQ